MLSLSGPERPTLRQAGGLNDALFLIRLSQIRFETQPARLVGEKD